MYIVFTVVYVSIVGNLFELGENNRFRYMIDPLIAVAAAATLSAAWASSRVCHALGQRRAPGAVPRI
jgi:hypothetical protein